LVIQTGLGKAFEVNSELRGVNRYKTFSEILANTSIVAAGVRYYLNLVSKASWNVDPANDSDEAKELADFTKDVMDDMETPWHRIIRRAAMYRMYGFSIQEWIAKSREDGRNGFFDVEPRPQKSIERWAHDEAGRIEGAFQRSQTTGKELPLPRGKIIYVVDDSLSDSPEGLGLFRHLAEPSNRLKEYLRLEQTGFQADLRGVPVARVPFAELNQLVEDGEISREQMNQLIQPIKDFMTNHIRSKDTGILLDSDVYATEDEKEAPSAQKKWGIDLLDGGNTSLEAVANAINRINHEIARILGVEQLLLGSDSTGSFALARIKAHNLFLIVDSTLTELSWSFRQDWVKPLWRLNGFERELMPKLKPESIQFRDIEQVTGAIESLARSGAPLDPDDPVIDEIRDLAGVSRRDFDQLLREAAISDQGTDVTDPNENEETEENVVEQS